MSDPSDTPEKKPPTPWLAVFLPLGISIGVAVGMSIHNLAAGIGMGVALGAGAGALLTFMQAAKQGGIKPPDGA